MSKNRISALLIALPLLFSVSCKDQTTNQDVSQSQQTEVKVSEEKSDEFIQTSYHPENYQEIIVDTTIAAKQSIQIHIKRYTLMDKSVSKTYDDEGTQMQDNYREYAAEVKLQKEGKVFYNEVLTKQSFGLAEEEDFMKQAILQSVWMDKYDEQKEEVVLVGLLIVPETDWSSYTKLFIDMNGKKRIEYLEDNQ